MAHYGGSTALPRAHCPRPTVMGGLAPATAPLPPLRPPPIFSLATPRPENQRSANEYVETPIRGTPPSPPPQPQLRPSGVPGAPVRIQRANRFSLPLPPVTKQPSAASFSKESTVCATRPSIMCPDCGRCRCASCQQPRPLPQKWICNNSCLLSADTFVDYASCLCCVKALFYHCSESDGGAESCADSPCSCGPNKRVARWSCLGALSCILPCLWLYWPLQACKQTVEMCYSRHSRTGCRCRPVLDTPEKRLLEPSPDL